MAKIIDQKGRLFGLINIIDLFVVLLILSFLPLLFIGNRFINRSEKTLDTKWVSVQIRLTDVEPEFLSVISAGDSDRDAFGKTIGTVLSVSKAKPSKVWVVVDNKMLNTIDHPVKKDVVVEASILCTYKKGVLYYKSLPVKIGNTITFETDKYNIPGYVAGFKVDDKARG